MPDPEQPREDAERHVSSIPQHESTEVPASDSQLTHETMAYAPSTNASVDGAPRVQGYQIERVLGRGGMGVVYLASDQRLKRRVALKMILAGSHAGKEDLARFAREAETVARLRHPNIVEIFDVGEHDGRPFFALEFVEGGCLTDYLGQNNMPARRAAALTLTLAKAMAFAHENGVVHRDLKPANILMGLAPMHSGLSGSLTAGRSVSDAISELLVDERSTHSSTDQGGLTPKVSDFGLAKLVDSDAGETRTGAVLGTPQYMSPEQAAGQSNIGPAADIYALGAILYALLTGRPPFIGETPVETMLMVQREEPMPPRRLQTKLPRDLETICLKCLEKQPARRYASAAELAADLQRFLADEPIHARPISGLERGAKWTKRHPTMAVAIMMLIVATCIVTWKWIEAAQANGELVIAVASEKAAKSEAAAAEQKAIRQRNESQRQTARLSLRKGIELCQQGQPAKGLHWMLAAAETFPKEDPSHAIFDGMVRRNVSSWSEHIHELSLLYKHPHWVEGVGFTPDGGRIVTSAHDGRLRIFSAQDNLLLKEIELSEDGSEPFLPALCIEPDGKWVVVGRYDGTLFQYDLLAHNIIRKWRGHEREIHSLAISHDGKIILSGSRDSSSRLWDAATGQPIGAPTKHDGAVRAVAFAPDGESFLTGTNPERQAGGAIQRWHTETRQPKGKSITAPFGVNTISFDPQGRRFVTGGPDGVARIWDANDHHLVGECRHASYIWGSVFSPDGRLFAVSCREGTTSVWDVATQRRIGSPLIHDARMFNLAFGPDGRRLITASQDGSARLWRLSHPLSRPPRALVNQLPARFSQPELWRNAFPRVVYSPNRQVVATSTPRAKKPAVARLWRAGSGRPFGVPMRHKGDTLRAMAFSPDGRLLATGGHQHGHVNGDAYLWDAQSGERLHTLSHTNYVCALAFSPNGETLAVGDYHSYVRLWDTRTGMQLGDPLVHTDIVFALAFSPDGKTLAVGTTADRTGKPLLNLWDVARRQLRVEPRPLNGRAQILQFSPEGGRLLSISNESQLWDGRTLEPIGERLPHAQGTAVVAFNPQGTLVALAGSAGQVRLCDTRDARVRKVLTADSGVTSLAFHSGGEAILVGCEDGSVQLWNVSTGDPLGAAFSMRSPILAVSFSEDGEDCQAVAANEVIRSWPAPIPSAGELAQLRIETQILTGLEMNDANEVLPLAADQWRSLATRHPALPPSHPDAVMETWHARQAGMAEEDRDWNGARWHLVRLAKYRPQDPWPQARLGRVHSSLEQLQEAEAFYRAAEDLLVEDAQALKQWRQHRVLECLDRQQERIAIWYLNRLINDDADNWRYYADRSEAYRQLGELQKSTADLEKAGQSTDDPELLATVINHYASQSRWNEVATVYSRMLSLSRSLPIDHYHRCALALLKSGETEAYQRLCHSILNSVAGQRIDANIVNLVGWLCAVGPCEKSDAEQALLLVEQMIKKLPENSKLRVAMLNTAGALSFRAEQMDKAVDYLQRSTELADGGSFGDWVFLAMVNQAQGKTTEATRWIQQATPTTSESATTFEQLENELLLDEARKLMREIE